MAAMMSEEVYRFLTWARVGIKLGTITFEQANEMARGLSISLTEEALNQFSDLESIAAMANQLQAVNEEKRRGE